MAGEAQGQEESCKQPCSFTQWAVQIFPRSPCALSREVGQHQILSFHLIAEWCCIIPTSQMRKLRLQEHNDLPKVTLCWGWAFPYDSAFWGWMEPGHVMLISGCSLVGSHSANNLLVTTPCGLTARGTHFRATQGSG